MAKSIAQMVREIGEHSPFPWTHKKGEICDAKGDVLFWSDGGIAYTNSEIADLIVWVVNERGERSSP